MNQEEHIEKIRKLVSENEMLKDISINEISSGSNTSFPKDHFIGLYQLRLKIARMASEKGEPYTEAEQWSINVIEKILSDLVNDDFEMAYIVTMKTSNGLYLLYINEEYTRIISLAHAEL